MCSQPSGEMWGRYSGGTGASGFFQGVKGPVQIRRVPERDRGYDKVQRHGVQILVQLGAVADRAALIEPDRSFQRVMRLTLVEAGVTRRRSSGSCSQDKVNEDRSIRPISRRATNR
jgi:hypothetical protein